MPRISKTFDLDAVEWRHMADPKETEFLIDFEYSLLGYDIPSGRLDMLLRFKGNGGHCRRHRHIAAQSRCNRCSMGRVQPPQRSQQAQRGTGIRRPSTDTARYRKQLVQPDRRALLGTTNQLCRLRFSAKEDLSLLAGSIWVDRMGG